MLNPWVPGLAPLSDTQHLSRFCCIDSRVFHLGKLGTQWHQPPGGELEMDPSTGQCVWPGSEKTWVQSGQASSLGWGLLGAEDLRRFSLSLTPCLCEVLHCWEMPGPWVPSFRGGRCQDFPGMAGTSPRVLHWSDRMMPAPRGSSMDTAPTPQPLFSPHKPACHLMNGSKLVTSQLKISGLSFIYFFF